MNASDRKGRTGWPDLLMGLATLLVVPVLYLETLTFRKMEWEPLGMAFWPQVVLGGLATIAVVFVVRGMRGLSAAEPIQLLALIPWAAGLAFLVLLPILGFYVAGFLLVAGLTLYLRPTRGVGGAVIAVANGLGTVALIHILFGLLLGLMLPSGALGF